MALRRRKTADTGRALVALDAPSSPVKRPAALDAGAGTPDPSAEALAAHRRATEAREQAALLQAQAQQRAAELVAEAQQRAAELELAARDADADAERLQTEADRDALIARLEEQLSVASAWQAHLTGQAAGLDAQAAEASARLAGLAERRRDAEQARADARQRADVDGVKDAAAELAAVGEVAASEAARLEQVQMRLKAIRGPGGELEQAVRDVAAATVELYELRRVAGGLPRQAEVLRSLSGSCRSGSLGCCTTTRPGCWMCSCGQPRPGRPARTPPPHASRWPSRSPRSGTWLR